MARAPTASVVGLNYPGATLNKMSPALGKIAQ